MQWLLELLGFTKKPVAPVAADEAPRPRRGKLGDILVGRGIQQPLQLERALWQQVNSRPERRLGRILVELGMVTSSQLYSALCHQNNLPETIL